MLVSALIAVVSGCGGQAAPPESNASTVALTVSQSNGGVSTLAMTLLPPVGSYLANAENKSSEVWLKDVQVRNGVSEKLYHTVPWYPPGTVSIGEPILVVTGTVQNRHRTNKEIAMYAAGYDEAGNQVAWTLDIAQIAGQIGLHLENNEEGPFTLHLNVAENIKTIRIYANSYPIVPP